MRTTRISIGAAVITWLGTVLGWPAAIQWDGGGDGTNWNNALNWAGDVVPVSTNDVILDVPGAGLIHLPSGNVVVRSLQCREALTLAGGTLTVTAGASQVDGLLTLASRTSLNARGTNTTFTALGSVAFNGATLSAQDGALIALPGASQYADVSGCCGALWEAQGAGSRLRLSGLTTLSGNGVVSWDLSVRARTGGRVELTNLTDVAGGAVSFYAENTNSLVDLSALTRTTNAARILVEARTDAAVDIPLLVEGAKVTVTRRSRGQVPTSQLTRLQSGVADGVSMDLSAVNRLTVGGSVTLLNGGTVDLNAITNVDGISFSSQGGTTLTLPAVRSYADTAGCCGTVLEASGAGSRLVFPVLTNVTGNPTWTMAVRALAGSRVELAAWSDLPAGNVSVVADGTNSVVDLSALQRVSGGSLALEARKAGSILSPQITDGTRVEVTLRSGGSVPTAQLFAVQSATADGMAMNLGNLTRLISRGSFTLLSGGTMNLTGVTNADGVSLHAQGGTTMSLPNVRTYSDTSGCCGALWEAIGSGSRIALGSLTNVAGNPTWTMSLRAQDGGRIELTSLQDWTAGNGAFLADGTNSVEDMSAWQRVSGGSVALEARDAGVILVPQIIDGSRVGVTLRRGGSISTSQFLALQSITVDGVSASLNTLTRLTSGGAVTLLNGGAVNLPAVTNVDGLSFSVPSGASLSLPAVRSYVDTSGCCGAVWESSGVNAGLIFSGLTNLSGNPTWSMQLNARGGGRIDLSALTLIPDSNVALLSDGTSSVIDLSRLARYSGTGHTLGLTAQNHGGIQISNLTRLNRGSVTKKSGGLISLIQLTNVDGSSFLAGAGEEIRVNVPSFADTGGCCGATWEANGTGAVLRLPALTTLTGNPSWALQLRAVNSGLVDVGSVLQMTDSSFNLLAEGTNSVIDLHQVTAFEPVFGTLTADVRLGGVILFNALERLNRATLILRNSGFLPTAQLTALLNSAVTVDGQSALFPNLTDVRGTTFSYLNGGSAPLPPVTDLAVIDIDAPPTGMAGQPLRLVWAVTNRSANAVLSGRHDRVSLSTDAAVGNDQILGEFAVADGVVPAAVQLVTNTVILPTGVSGNRWIVVQTDSRYEVYEGTNEANNVLVGNQPIAVSSADLVVDQLTVPTNAAFGATILVSWRVRNAGSLAASVPWLDAIYLSTNAAISPGAVTLGSFAALTTPLASGATYSRTQSVSLPLSGSLAPGSWFIVIKADTWGFQPEADKNNNTRASSALTISRPPLPDLAVVSVSAPGSAVPGSLVPVSWMVTNQGAAVLSDVWEEAVVLSKDVLPGSDTLLASFVVTNTIFPGAFLTRTQWVIMPVNGPAGALFLGIDVDHRQDVVESIETNNLIFTPTFTQVPSSLTLWPPTVAISENAVNPALTVRVSRNGDLTSALVVSLFSSSPARLQVPPTVTIPANVATAAFAVNVAPDGIVSGDKAIQLTALAGGFVSGTNVVTLTEGDTPHLTLSVATGLLVEGQDTEGTVSRDGPVATALTVTLANPSPGQVSTPASIAIPAGASSVSFPVIAVDDFYVESPQTYELGAAAPGYVRASTGLHVTDNDLPTLILSLRTTHLSEGAAPGTATLAITREFDGIAPLRVQIHCSRPDQLSVPNEATFAPGELEKFVILSPIEDGTIESDAPVTLTVQARETLSLNPILPGVSTNLFLLDNDGPALQFELARDWICARGTNGGLGALSVQFRRTGNTNAVAVVTLSSDAPGFVSIPASANFAANQTALSLAINATGLSPAEPQRVTLRATAAGYSEAVATFTLAAECGPDLVISNVTTTASGLTDTYFSVNYREQNIGSPFAIVAQPPGITNIAQKVFLSVDPYPGGDLFWGAVLFDGAVNPYTFLERSATFRLPGVPGDYWVIVQADGSNSVAEVSEQNNFARSTALIHVDPAYTATVTAEPHSALAGTPVLLSGNARKFGSPLPAPFEIISLHVGWRGSDRVIAALTDADGNFSTLFTPLPGEAGTYTVGAAHPGVTNVAVQDTFTILGIKASPATLTVRLPAFDSATQEVALKNLGDIPLNGLTANVIGAPPEFNVTVTVSPVLVPFGEGQLLLNLRVAADTNLTRLFTVRVTSAEGAIADVIVTLQAESLRPRLIITPNSLVGGATRQGQSFVEFAILNAGGASSGPLQVVLPSVPFLNVATPMPMPALAPGESNIVTLRLAPSASTALGEYTGSLLVSGAGDSASVPFNFRVLSTNQGTLRVEVTDQFTYYAEGAPRVTNALVELRDPYTGVTLATRTNDAQGVAIFNTVAEGYYALHVSADDHEPYRRVMFVGAGGETYQEALLTREVVQFIWNVVPTEIGDRTHITIEAIFETVVPLPVVTVEPSVIDLANFPNGGMINLTVTNHGLLAAQQTRIAFSDFDCWKITPLISDLGTLAARSAMVVPVRICRDVTCSRQFTTCGTETGQLAGAAGADSAAERNAMVAGQLAQIRPAAGGGAGGNCGGGAVRFIVPCGIGAVGGGAPIGVENAGGDCEWHPVGGSASGSGTLGGTSPIGGAPCDPCALNLLKAILKCAIKFIPLPDWAKCAKDGYECASGLNDGLSWKDAYKCLKAGVNCAKAAGKQVPWPKWIKTIECAYEILTACPDRLPGLGGAGPGDAPAFAPAFAPAQAGGFVTMPELYPLHVRSSRMSNVTAYVEYLFGSSKWFQEEDTNVWSQWLDAWDANTETNSGAGERISSTERAALLALPLPTGVTPTDANAFLDRWNRSLDYWQAGIFYTTNVPAGNNTNFVAIDRLKTLAAAAHAAVLASEAEGFPTLVDGVEAAKFDLQTYLSRPQDGICAHVRLKIDQEAVIARDAFRATLDILNNSSSPLTNIAVDLVAYRPDGSIATTLFGFSPPALNAITAVDGAGRVNAGVTAAVAWNVLPTIDAAPEGPQIYYVGGSIRYVQDGVSVTVPLALISITVHPLPQLHLTYFHQRDVLGDDPFTDEVEPSVPYSLAVMVRNEGAGTARRLQITSAQPQIVENEKGLFIDFQIIATEVAGKNLVPSLTADFGDVSPGAIAIGQWLFKSTLQGLFIDYRASFEHLDNLGDARLSLIQSVGIRELIRIVRAPGVFEDRLPDMLVNDFPDLEDLPDTLYLSNGQIVPVSVAQAGVVTGSLGPQNLHLTLDAPLPVGWSYLRLPDPANGRYRLVRVVRSDGVALSVSTNVWTTDRTFIGGGHRPVKENKLHLLDYDSPGHYVLTYESLAPSDVTAPSSQIRALPVVSEENIPVIWSGEDDAGGSGVAFYDVWVSQDGGTFLPWLQQTRSTAGIYTGVQGHTYSVYSVATDASGNRENAPTVPDAITSVSLINSPPSLADVQLAINEGDTLRYTNLVADPNVPPQTLTFGLIGAVPAGLTLGAQTGVLTWPTSETTGPSTSQLLVRVTDNGFPNLSATGRVTIAVREVNRAPTLSVITNRVVREGHLLMVTNVATDPDLPLNALTFSLGSGAPAGVSLNPLTGLLSWRPTEFQGGVTNRLAVIVTDNGVPPLSATQQFNVIVRDTLRDFELSVGSTTVLAGESGIVSIALKSSLELNEVSFFLGVPATSLSSVFLRATSPEVRSALMLPAGPNVADVRFELDPDLAQIGLRSLAELSFGTRPTNNSSIVRLPVTTLAATTPSEQLLGNAAARDGLIYVVGQQPLLEARALTNGWIELSIHGRPGRSYVAEAALQLTGPVWSAGWTGLQTNRVQVFQVQAPTNSTQFWRAREQ